MVRTIEKMDADLRLKSRAILTCPPYSHHLRYIPTPCFAVISFQPENFALGSSDDPELCIEISAEDDGLLVNPLTRQFVAETVLLNDIFLPANTSTRTATIEIIEDGAFKASTIIHIIVIEFDFLSLQIHLLLKV